jgi:hypothetical protein
VRARVFGISTLVQAYEVGMGKVENSARLPLENPKTQGSEVKNSVRLILKLKVPFRSFLIDKNL